MLTSSLFFLRWIHANFSLIKLGYNPILSRADCPRLCGNTSVPFPFGLEDGCFATKQFHLNCTNMTSSAAVMLGYDQVVNIDIHDGTLNVTNTQLQSLGGYFTDGLFLTPYGSPFSSMLWVAANLSCAEAQKNMSRYACVSINSTCMEVSIERRSAGYRCKCSDGFQGNPYIQSGCRGTPLFSLGLQMIQSLKLGKCTSAGYFSTL